jgi:hypothetical protein
MITGCQYGEDLNCEWLITSVDGQQIEVEFEAPFHVEVSSYFSLCFSLTLKGIVL